MKIAVIVLFAIAAMGGAAVGYIKDKKDEATECQSVVDNLNKVGSDYTAQPTAQNCKTYAAAIQNYLDSDCASNLTHQQKAVYQAMLNEFAIIK
jgi:uncharacterized protein YaaR (DUF327 family)